MSNEVILAVDGAQERFFKNNPSALKELIADIGDDLQNLRNFSTLLDKRVKTSTSSAPVPFEKQGSVLVAPSHLYKNVYYVAEHYDELYRRDLDTIMYALACRMGASSYESSFEMQVAKKINKSFLNKIVGKFVSAKGQANLKSNIKFEKLQDAEMGRKVEFIEQGKELVHSSKGELQAFIDEENIDIKALPPKFADKVKLYLEGKDIAAERFENTEEVSISSQNLTAFSLNLHLNVIAASGNIVADDFMSFREIDNFKFASKISYTIDFATKNA